MKKTVFLFLLVLIFSTSKPVGAVNDNVYQFDDYEIRVDLYSNDNNGRGYYIEKLGENPFVLNVIYDNIWLTINNVKEIDGNHVFYGYSHVIDSDDYYDTFMIVLDPQGNQIYQETNDYGDLDAVHDVVEIDNVILVHYNEYYDDGFDILFLQNNIKIYDHEYNLLDEITTYNEYGNVSSTDQLYLYSFNEDNIWEGAFTSDLNIITIDESLDIPTGSVYHDEITILFLNDAILNNQIVSNGVTIDYPGNYELTYYDFTYKFIVVPTLTGIEDDAVYNQPVSANITAGNVYLNNDLYVSGTVIDKPGNYQLQIIGSNNYVEEYNFTITSNISGVLHNQTYNDPVEIEFEGKGYLNNTYIESPHTVVDEGEYILRIQGENNYLETYYFDVTAPEDETSLVSFVQKYDVIFLAVVVVSGGLILKKK